MNIKLLILFMFLGQCLISQDDGLYHEIDKIIRYDTEIKYPIEKSFVVGIIHEDTSYIVNFGPEHIDSFDLFEIGGLTKVFTATLATKLWLSELLDLKASINSYLPSKYRNQKLESFNLEDLLMHKIKFPKRPADLSKKEYNISLPYAYYTKEDVLSYYSSFEPPGILKWVPKSVNYSHINYALLEIIIEQELKMPLEDLFQLYLFQQMGMSYSSLSFQGENLATGYDRSNLIPDPWSYKSFAGSEGLVSCMADLLKFTRMSIEADDGVNLESQIFRDKSKISKKLGHSYAWYIMNSKKTGDIYTHSGVTERHKAYIHFKKESRTGVVILCQSSVGVGELGLLILRMINNNWN